MNTVGFPIAVFDADHRVRAAAKMVTRRPGGHAAVREAIDGLIQAKGLMERGRGPVR
jgi:3-deoxy-D-manno-octulosonate 8-phosphate phosphatase KdsC-like HAD superfamily phosphatase